MIRDTPLPDTQTGRSVPRIPILGTVYWWFRRYPVLPVMIAIGLAVMAIFAPWVAPNHPLESELDKLAAPPVWQEGGTWDYVLGADKIGRDLLSRIIHGSRISLSVAFIVIICGSVIGSGIGIASGMAGGIWDEIAMRIVDLVYATPFQSHPLSNPSSSRFKMASATVSASFSSPVHSCFSDQCHSSR